MARRTQAAFARSKARKQARLQEQWGEDAWRMWRTCEVCERKYCANNYQDRRTRVKRWHGIEICAYCRYNCIKYLPQLERLGKIKIRKVKA